MDAGWPVLVSSPAGRTGTGSSQPSAGSPLRVVGERPVLIAIELCPAHDAAWEDYTVVPLRFAALSVGHLLMLAPAAVAIPLWSRGADAVQMLQRLDELGYAGPVEVHGPSLPNARMVIAELTQVAAGLRVRLVEHPEAG